MALGASRGQGQAEFGPPSPSCRPLPTPVEEPCPPRVLGLCLYRNSLVCFLSLGKKSSPAPSISAYPAFYGSQVFGD